MKRYLIAGILVWLPLGVTVLVIKAPGGCPADARDLPYRNLKPGTRLGPKGPPIAPLTNR